MAAETEDKTKETPEELKQEPEEPKQTPEGPKQEPKKPSEPPKQREILLTIMTILFVLVGIAELGLLSITGLGLFRGIQAQRAYEAQQTGLPAETGRPLSASYSGPGLIIENGEVVWRRTDDLTQSGVSSGQGIGTGTDGETTAPTLKTPYPPPPWSQPDSSSETQAVG